MSKIIKNYLTDYGYNVIALPKTDIRPLLLLSQDGDSLTSLESPLTSLFRSDETAPPTISTSVATGDVVGSSAVAVDADTGFSLLNTLLEKLKMGKMEAKASFHSNVILTFHYQQVKEDKIDLVSLDSFLTEAIPVIGKFNTFQKKLQNSELYIINAVLKSNAFSVTVEDKDGISVNVDATVKGILSVNPSFRKTSDRSLAISNANGTEPLVFAFKAQHILYGKGSFLSKLLNSTTTDQFTIKNTTGVVLRGPEDYPTEPFPVRERQSIEI